MKILLLLASLLLQDNETHAKLVSARAEPAAVMPGGTLELRFEIEIDPGWHVYPAREQPATVPTTFELSGPVAVAGEIRNPPTRRVKDGPVEYDAIEGKAVFVVPVRVDAMPGPLAIRGVIRGQTCRKVCMDFDLPFEIPITVQDDGKPRVKILSIRPAKTEAKNGEPVRVEFALEIPQGWHVYPANRPLFGTPMVFDPGPRAFVRGRVEEPEPKRYRGPPADYTYHEGAVTVTVPIALRRTEPGPVELNGVLKYQICSPKVCLDSKTPFSFTLTSLGGKDVDLTYEEHGFLGLILLGMLGGLISLMMPCTYPLVPVTLTYFFKQAAGSRTHGLVLACAYALGIIWSFTGLGFLLTALVGAGGAREFAANPWVNVGVGALFLLFTGSLFGWYEIRLPFGLGEKLAAGGPRKGITGALLLGFLFSVVTFTCTIPILGTVFVVTAGQYPTVGLVAMLAYSITMAAPFVAMGLLPGMLREMPRPGGWLTTVRISMAWVELGLALFYFSKADQVWQIGLLSRPLIVVVWVLLCAIVAVYLLDLLRKKPRLARLPFVALFVGLGAFIAFGITGRPLGLLEIVVPQPPIHGSTMPEALKAAQASGKPLFVEFTGVT